mmetsp:Transcript_40602/g.71443  ORF Transcript_40602/g.71443 Transcript_40602/m.71443 type:complete len:233 (-) Transcript_40602:86-784(-)
MRTACRAFVNLLLSSVTLTALSQEHKQACAKDGCPAMIPGDELAEGLEMLQFQSSKKPNSKRAKLETLNMKHSSHAKLADASAEDGKQSKSHEIGETEDHKHVKADSSHEADSKAAEMKDEDVHDAKQRPLVQACDLFPIDEFIRDEYPKGPYMEPGGKVKAKFPRTCAKKCFNKEGCKSWAFIKDAGKINGVCYLKDYGPAAGFIKDATSDGYISGFKCKGTKKGSSGPKL